MSRPRRRRFIAHAPVVASPLRRAPGVTVLSPVVAQPLNPITFPATPLKVNVRIALDADPTADPATWLWEDIAALGYVRFDPSIYITDGRPDESSTVTTGTARLTLDNRDGRFSRRNPMGAYYGKLSKNTPIWIEVDPGDGGHTLFQGFVNSWPPRWRSKGADALVPIECAGILRRLQQTPGEAKSAPRRWLENLAPSLQPVGSWLLEDSELATIGEPLYGAYAMGPFSGTHPSGAVITLPVWGGGELAPWLPSVVSRTGNAGLTVLRATVSMPAFSNTWTVDWFYNSGTDAAVTTVDVNPSYLPGGATGWPQVIITPSVQGVDVAMNTDPESAATVTTLFDSKMHHMRWTATQSGSNVAWVVSVDGVTVNSGTTVSAMTLTAMSSIGLTAEAQSGAVAQGYISVWTTPPPLSDAVDAAFGHSGEQAHERISRLCSEFGVRYTSFASSSQAMGPQPVGNLMTLVRECEKADQGVLYEHDWGLAYQSVRERYNAPVSLSLNFNSRHVATEPEPADDDQRTRNKWTITRWNGLSATAEQITGEMGTSRAGEWAQADTINVQTDDQAENQAGWRVYLGTVDEDRWPSISMRMHSTPDLIPQWTALRYGARMQAANPPPEVAPDTIDAVIESHVERITSTTWDVTAVTSPASPYTIGVVDDTRAPVDIPRIGSTTATIGADLTDSYTGTVSVTTGADGLWTTTATFPADFPLSVNIGGERMTISAISGTSSPQTFTISARSVNGVVKAHTSGASIKPWRTATAGL